MLKFILKHRRRLALSTLFFFVAVLLILRVFQHRIPATGHGERAALAVFVPIGDVFQTVLHLPENLVRDFNELRRVRQENERLRSEMADLQQQVIRMKSLESDQARLADILKIKPPAQSKARLVRVVAQDPSTWNNTFLIGSGRDDGISPDSPVVAPQGIVGRVMDVFPNRSRVLLAESPTSSVAVVDVRSRVRGVAVGTGSYRLKMDFVAAGDDVQNGDEIVSSGMGGVFPRGYPVGTVIKKGTTNNGLTLDIELAPAVDFGSIDYVFILEPVEDLP